MSDKPVVERTPSIAARLGFRDPARANRFLAELGLVDHDGYTDAAAESVTRAAASSGDPDLTVLCLVRLAETSEGSELMAAIRNGPAVRARLCAVLGASRALGDWLCANPTEWRVLRDRPDPDTLVDRLFEAVGARRDDPMTGSHGTRASVTGPAAVRALRLAYRRCLLDLAGGDLTGSLRLEEVTDQLSALADALVQVALSVSAAELDGRLGPHRLAVIAMGKCGAQELNYVSDVDVIFVAEALEEGAEEEAALRSATMLAAGMMRICGEVAWAVDAALRPEGKAGQLVRTMEGHRSYYRRWARTWEFQALLKARPMAGDPDLGAQYAADVAALAWTAAERDDFVDDVRAMRRRVEDHVPDAKLLREIKLGPGGLRDVEFAVQLLQLVHGRADESIRVPDTLGALAVLSVGGYISRADGLTLSSSYNFLRAMEHRLMLQRLRRTHLLPEGRDEMRWLARSMGYAPGPAADEVQALEHDRVVHFREVRRLHEKLFYRPLLSAVAAVPTDGLRLTPEAAITRLAALGFARPDGALKHVQALTSGTNRTATMQRMLLPAMLSMLADSADPDAGLLAYRQVSEQLDRTPWYLRFLRDEGVVAERLAHVLGSSRYASGLLSRAPESIRMLAEMSDLEVRGEVAIETKMRHAVARQDDPAKAVGIMRSLRRNELLRIACADLLDLVTLGRVGRALSSVADATIAAALDTATRAVVREHGPLACEVAVIAMGRLGGHEMSYGSDADVMFVFEPLRAADPDDAAKSALRVVELMSRLLAAPGPDPALVIDTALRPEGRSGNLVRSLTGYAEYYERWAAPWERQALVRARPIAGDGALGAQFVQLIGPLRYPAGGLPEPDLREIRRIKARVDHERLPRGANPARHTKLGPGGLADVEWTAQLLQLGHAAQHPQLQTTETLEALNQACGAGLIEPDDAAALEGAWRLASRIRNAIVLITGKAHDELPSRNPELVAIARLLGYPPTVEAGQFEDDYRRATRRAHAVSERIFYGR